MALGPLEPIEAPAFEPEPHGLLASARTVQRTGVDGEKWVSGFYFEPEGCYEVDFWDPACRARTEDDPVLDKSEIQPMPGWVSYTPWVLETAVGCNPAGYTWEQFVERAERRLENGTSWGLERELWTGGIRGLDAGFDADAEDERLLPNFALQDMVEEAYVDGACSGVLNAGTGSGASAVWTPVSPKQALSLLIQALSASVPGGVGFIHTPPRVASLWTDNGSLTEQGDRLLTKVKRNVVVAGGGYPGTGPGGDVPDDGQMWVYATGPVHVRLTSAEVISDQAGENFNRRTNYIEARAERWAATVVDPNRVFAVLVDLSGESSSTGGGDVDGGSP